MRPLCGILFNNDLTKKKLVGIGNCRFLKHRQIVIDLGLFYFVSCFIKSQFYFLAAQYHVISICSFSRVSIPLMSEGILTCLAWLRPMQDGVSITSLKTTWGNFVLQRQIDGGVIFLLACALAALKF